MTVKQLQEILTRLPSDAEVLALSVLREHYEACAQWYGDHCHQLLREGQQAYAEKLRVAGDVVGNG